MNDLELIQLYQELTASGEALARSVAIFVGSLPLAAPEDVVPAPAPPRDAAPAPTQDIEPPPGAED